MSYTTILELKQGRDPVMLTELMNSHGSAPVIWDEIGKRHLGWTQNWRLQDLEILWPLHKRKDIPFHHRAVLMMTFDNAYVKRKNFKRAAKDIRKFMQDFPKKEGKVNHWPAIADLFDKYRKKECHAIGIWHTSVTENPFLGDYDDESEVYLPIDWKKLYEIYETLEAIK